MPSEARPKVVHLNPGEFAFAEGDTLLQTLLGSCVAVTFWERNRPLGAMCHYIFPTRPTSSDQSSPGKYADEVLAAIARRVNALGIRVDEVEVRMFGGGNMFPMQPIKQTPLIGDLNIEAGKRHLKALGFSLSQADLGGEVHRKIAFNVRTGRVQVEHGAAKRQPSKGRP